MNTFGLLICLVGISIHVFIKANQTAKSFTKGIISTQDSQEETESLSTGRDAYDGSYIAKKIASLKANSNKSGNKGTQEDQVSLLGGQE